MKKEEENPPAFAAAAIRQHGSGIHQKGMLLRDYFAAKHLQGISGDHTMWANMCMDYPNCKEDGDTFEDYLSRECYKIADAMLKQRVK